MRPIPQTAAAWVDEIAAAYEDAREALPFTAVVGVVAGSSGALPPGATCGDQVPASAGVEAPHGGRSGAEHLCRFRR
jgi:hypothetical protein